VLFIKNSIHQRENARIRFLSETAASAGSVFGSVVHGGFVMPYAGRRGAGEGVVKTIFDDHEPSLLFRALTGRYYGNCQMRSIAPKETLPAQSENGAVGWNQPPAAPRPASSSPRPRLPATSARCADPGGIGALGGLRRAVSGSATYRHRASSPPSPKGITIHKFRHPFSASSSGGVSIDGSAHDPLCLVLYSGDHHRAMPCPKVNKLTPR